MAKLAAELPTREFGPPRGKGPKGACYVPYHECDNDDFLAVKALKDTGLTWEQIQEQVDAVLGIEEPIPTKKFTYHWRQLCTCWRDK